MNPRDDPQDRADALDADEREELTRLRRELATRRTGRTTLRWSLTLASVILIGVLALASVLARFVHGELLDTDRYVQTVAPLSTDPTLLAALTDRITTTIMARLDIETVTAQALRAIAEDSPRVPPAVVGLAPVIEQQVHDFVHETTESVLHSDEFTTLWIQANRQAHQGLVTILTGDTREAIAMDDTGTVTISLAPIIDRVRTALTDRGFTFAERVPTIDESFVLFESPQLVKAQRWASTLDRVADLLPWITALLAVVAVWAAPKGGRRRAFSWVGAALAVAMVVLAATIGIARSAYVHATPADALSPAVAAVMIDAFLTPLRTTLRAVFALGVVIALIGFLSGPSASATAVRARYNRALAAIRARRTDRAPLAIESAAARFRSPLRVLVIAAAAVTLIAWSYPTGSVVVVTVVVTAASLLVVELLAAPG
ncbi:hypothetical protein [Nocardia yamanashiensis]|uniref:hypothetical protein n=1 Tax=Nocardia yamanashiensis TaxID=209247 RepID=UPI0008343997|nr:hypothetical protein [Nocardia yamanashiensis]